MPAVLLPICRQQCHQGTLPSAHTQRQQGVTHCLLERTLSPSAWLRIEEDERRGEGGRGSDCGSSLPPSWSQRPLQTEVAYFGYLKKRLGQVELARLALCLPIPWICLPVPWTCRVNPQKNCQTQRKSFLYWPCFPC